MSCLEGFNERFGTILKEKDYINRVFTNIAYTFGFEEIQIPLLEKASTFSETIVGKSPWPEWNEKGCFFFDINNYYKDYNMPPKKEKVLLIPEGTLSVTRWLGEKLDNYKVELPLKMYYNLTCYRNELINEISDFKKREFGQFGYEILGSNNIFSDMEIISLAFHSLFNLGIDKSKIRIRLSDINIFAILCKESSINEDDVYVLKELLDYYAECKAGKHQEKLHDTYKKIINILNNNSISKDFYKKWILLIENNTGEITEELYDVFGKKYHKYFDELKEIQKVYLKENLNIHIDLCVIRSHEYYTGISFEVDVLNENGKNYIEIAGGGRFDRLVTNFITNKDSKELIVPCTGFAFGSERVLAMCKDLNIFKNKKSVETIYNFDYKNITFYYSSNPSALSYNKILNKALLKKEPFFINVKDKIDDNYLKEMKNKFNDVVKD